MVVWQTEILISMTGAIYSADATIVKTERDPNVEGMKAGGGRNGPIQ